MEDKVITHNIRQKILQKLMHSPGTSFNELWDKSNESNTFAYHLKNLEMEKVIEKKEGKYFLTQEGKEYVAFIEGSDGSKSKKPLACTGVVIIKKNKILLNKRKKEPFIGYYGLGSAGKINFGETPIESAKRELQEETGLRGELKLIAIYNMITYNLGIKSYHHIHFIYIANEVVGSERNSNEGELEWVDLEKIDAIKPIFPDIAHIIEIAKKNKFSYIDMKRYMEGDKFIKIETITQ